MVKNGANTAPAARPRIWFVAQQPPPVNGQNVFNKRMLEAFETFSDVRCLALGGHAGAKIWRALINPLILFFMVRRGDIVYGSLPGQLGAWLFLPTVLALRLRRQVLYLHHHSFRAVAIGPLRAIACIERLGGTYLRHIMLCERMRDGFAALYSDLRRDHIRVLPNAALFGADISTPLPQRTGDVRIGHMSVMTEDKGVRYLIDLWTTLVSRGGAGKLILAGPIPDPGLQRYVEAAVAAHPDQIEWRGPLSGNAKAQFFEEIDLFVLPTKLIDEADPLVLLEAYAVGAAVLAPDRGCIRGRLLSEDWLMSMNEDTDIVLLQDKIDQVLEQRGTLPETVRAHCVALNSAAQTAGEALFSEFGASSPAIQKILGHTD